MNTNSHPIVIYKKIDIVYTRDEEKHHEVKIKKYSLPNFDLKIFLQILKVFLFILLVFVLLTNKSKEAAPIMSVILEQLQ